MIHLRAGADLPTAPRQVIKNPVVDHFRAIGPVLALDRASLVIVPRPAVGHATVKTAFDRHPLTINLMCNCFTAHS